jgi:methylated-DNA-[protein]-cysteine S-methyltransferase
MSTTTYTRGDSAFGPLLLRAQHGTLTGLFFADRPHASAIGLDWTRDDEADIFVQTLREVNEFAAGERHEFHVDAGLAGRPFQVQVWREIAAIPFGETLSYGEISRQLGASPRAVGSATGRNPLSIIIPCHRVVGASGALTGYAGGLDLKKRLLALERTTASCTFATA